VATRKLRVAVLFGGRSAEHEISLLSARFVVEALDRQRFEPVLVGIDKSGRWLLQEEALLLAGSRDPRRARLDAERPDVALAPHPGADGAGSLTVARTGADASRAGSLTSIDVVFPVLHGPMGEDGTVQGLLELAGVPYVGAGVLGSAVGMDKDVMKRLLAQAELPIVPYRTVRGAAWRARRDEVLADCAELGLPVFVKPANLGSSVGVSRVTDAAALAEAIELAMGFDDKVVVEQGLAGVREIECSVLGNDDPRASLPGEIVVGHPDGFYSYAAKYLDESGATTVVPAQLAPAQVAAVQLLAIRTFQALDCAGLARVDFFLAGGELYVNEINTMPGFTAISMYPKLWEASGLPARELVSTLVDLALERAGRRRALRTSY
jgi:D-alanine-D-alanine ligase